MMAAASALYAEQYDPHADREALSHFGDGDLFKLTSYQKAELMKMSAEQAFELPNIQRISNRLCREQE